MSAPFLEGQVVTVFRSRLRSDADPRYTEHAAEISALAQTMPGYVEHKSFTADDGERVTIATFDGMASQQAWRRQVDHVAAQRAGVASYYTFYSLQVATVERVSGFDRS